MPKLSNIPLLCALGALPLSLVGGCVTELPKPNGTCVLEPSLDCSASPIGTTPQPTGLVGYTCTGTARPDEGATYEDEIPLGSVCADRGATADGKQGYCCAPQQTSCALDPSIPCAAGEAAFQCQGSTRPDAYNAALNCENGVRDGLYISYCCTGQTPPPHCQAAQGNCGEVLQGFNCPAGVVPKNEDLGANESRADYYRFFCPVPQPTPSGKVFQYCCYMPLPPMDGFSCVQDTTVPGCAPGRFGFACYGYDKPNEDYPPMHCPDPGFSGKSAEGYPATLYCCDFKE